MNQKDFGAALLAHQAAIARGEPHIYLSTYCQHGKHKECRLRCKIGHEPCICSCHVKRELAA